jgi:hypothetical protein
LLHDTGSGKRNTEGRDDLTGVTQRGGPAAPSSLDDRHISPLTREFTGAAEPDNATSDNGNPHAPLWFPVPLFWPSSLVLFSAWNDMFAKAIITPRDPVSFRIVRHLPRTRLDHYYHQRVI